MTDSSVFVLLGITWVVIWAITVTHRVQMRAKDTMIDALNKISLAQAIYIQAHILDSNKPTEQSAN
jgi:hypothetical protein